MAEAEDLIMSLPGPLLKVFLPCWVYDGFFSS